MEHSRYPNVNPSGWSPDTRYYVCGVDHHWVSMVSLWIIPSLETPFCASNKNHGKPRSHVDTRFDYQHQRSTMRTCKFNSLTMTQIDTPYWTHFHRLLGSDHLILPCCLFTLIWSMVFVHLLPLSYSIISRPNSSYCLSKIWKTDSFLTVIDYSGPKLKK